MEIWPPTFDVSGDHVSVVELSMAHKSDLVEAAADGEFHRLWYTRIPSPDGIEAEIERRLALRKQGSMLPFAVINRASGTAVGVPSRTIT